MKTKGILLIAFLALLLHDASCATLKNTENVPKMAAELSTKGYKLGKLIGNGNYAKVYLATIDGKEVAIKIMDKARLDDDDIEDVYFEAKILKNVDHPHIIRFFAFLDMSEEFCIVTEYAIGGDMDAYLKNNPKMTEPEVCDKMKQIVDAVDYLHDRNIAHGDLKPANVLLDKIGKDANVKLADFGFVTMSRPDLHLETDYGTPNYMAPEIYNEFYYGAQTDVWALGCTLYELLTREKLFYGQIKEEIKKQVFNKEISASAFEEKGISPDGADLLCRMLERDAKKRFTIKQVKNHKWMQISVKKPASTSSNNEEGKHHASSSK